MFPDRHLEIKSDKETIIIYDLQAQLYIRKADGLVRAGDYIRGVEALEDLRSFVKKLDRTYVDITFVEHISKTRSFCLKNLEQRAPSRLRSRVGELFAWVESFVAIPIETRIGTPVIDQGQRNIIGPWGDADFVNADHVYVGCLKEAGRQPTLGFLVTQDGREVFVHKLSVPRETWILLQSGAYVNFKIRFSGDRGPTAVDVQPSATISWEWKDNWQKLWNNAQGDPACRVLLAEQAKTWLRAFDLTEGGWTSVWKALWQANNDTFGTRTELADLAERWLQIVGPGHPRWAPV